MDWSGRAGVLTALVLLTGCRLDPAVLDEPSDEPTTSSAPADSPHDDDRAGDDGEETHALDPAEAGTDSATPPPSQVELDAATEARLADFGQAYLGYDYRADHEARAALLEPLVTPRLLTELAAPLPAVLTAQLEAEERVVEAELISIALIDVDLYQVTFSLSGSLSDSQSEVRTLIVAMGSDGVITDVL